MIRLHADSARPKAGKMFAAALVLLMAGGLMSNLPAAVANPDVAGPPVVRVGTVLATPLPTAAYVAVRFEAGGPTHVLPYQAPYVPVTGDQVNVLWYAASGATMAGVVLGGQSGRSGNLVTNGDFQRAPILVFPPVNNPPYLWTRYTPSGTPADICQIPNNSFQRLHMGYFISGLNSGDTYAYHAGFPVNAGETLRFNMLGRVVVFASTSVTVTTRVGWFAAATDVYPSFISESVIGTDVTAVDANLYHTNTATVPAGASHARVAVRAQHTGSAAGSGYTLYVSEAAAHR